MNRTVVSALTLAVAAVAATTASAAPTPTTLEVVLQPGQRVAMTMSQVPRGEFRFVLKASSDGVKKFVLSQQRVGSTRFKVLDGASACDAAAGTLLCSNISTPAPTATGSYIFRLTNLSARPMSMTLKISWRKITSAG